MLKNIVLIAALSSVAMGDNLTQLIDKSINNKIIEASKKNIEASRLDYSSLKNKYLPSLSLGANYSDTSNETASVANNGFSSFVKLEYNIYDGGKKSNSYDAFESKIKSESLNLEDLKNKIALDVISLYFNYLSLEEMKKAKLQEIKQLDTQYENRKKFFETQTIAIDEVEKILSRLENANVSLQEIELEMQKILHTLEYITGKEVTIDNGSTIKKTLSKQAVLRADIQALEYDMKTLKSNAKAQKSEIYPQLNVSNTYSYYDQNYNNKMYDPNVDTQNTLSLNLSWKFYDFNSTKKAYESNMKRYLSLKSQYEYEKNRMSVDLKLAYKSYDIAKIKIKSAEATVHSANTTYSAIESKYQNTLVDNVTYLEALSEKYQALSTLKSAQYDLQIKRANIIYHSGKNLIDFIK